MSSEQNTIRKPKQARSKQMAEKILDTALRLFCDKGYYSTTTNEIAKEAHISIGSLYAYYQDKDAIFLEILTQYHQRFLTIFDLLDNDENRKMYLENKKEWLHMLLDELMKRHLAVKNLNRELKALYYTKGEVRAVMDEQTDRIKMAVLKLIQTDPDPASPGQMEITVLLIVDFISAIVDRLVFDDRLTALDKEYIVSAGVDAVYKFVYE